MSWIDRLFGLKDGTVPFIGFSGPSDRPQLPPELKPFVQELAALYRSKNSFDYTAREKTREIGTRINDAHGFNGMQKVCDTIRFEVNAKAARELEYVWDHIGEWRN